MNNVDCLKEQLRAAYNKIGLSGRKCALVDLPKHLNIGDSLIGCGQFELLKKTGHFVFVGARPDESVLAEIDKDCGVILIHGGGNFGSIWPEHQNFREELALTCTKTTIIQLPQTVFFTDNDSLEKSMRVIERHPDFHIMVRDKKSISVLERFNVKSLQLVPDSAMILKPVYRSFALYDVLIMKRADRESKYVIDLDRLVEELSKQNKTIRVEVADWANDNDLPRNSINTYGLINWFVARVVGRTKNATFHEKAWGILLKKRYELGVKTLAKAKIVVTDRLHVHILCYLMGKPHVFFDNAYGKIFNYSNSWGTHGSSAIAVSTWEEALANVKQLLQQY